MWKVALGLDGWAAGEIGVCEYNYPIEEILDRAVEMGYEGIEPYDLSVDPFPKDLGDMSQIKEFKKKYDERGLRIPGVQTHSMRTAANASEDERTAAAGIMVDNVIFAKALGCEWLGVWPGPREYGVPDTEIARRLVETFTKFFKKLKEEQIDLGKLRIVFETEPVECFHNLDIAKTVIDEVNHPNFGLLFDFAHININTNGDPLRAVRLFKGKIGHVHLSDNDGTQYTSSVTNTSKHLIIGEGNMNIREILEELRDTGYEGWIECDVWQYPDPFQCARVNKIVVDNILKNIGMAST